MADYGSALRDQALILALLQESNLASRQVDQRLFALSDELAANRWLSTQERNALFLAGRGLLGKPEGQWQARLDSAGEVREFNNAESGMKLEGPLLASPLSVQNQGSETLYQQLTLSGYPRQAPAAVGNGMQIRREYLGMNGQPLDLHNLRSGDLVLVHLALKAEDRVPDALVVDLLPAGLELENQNLASSSASLQDSGSEVQNLLSQMQQADIQHMEFRDDRFVAAVPVNEGQPVTLVYLARAVTPGTYQVPVPMVESMYVPQWRATGAASGPLIVVP